MKKFIIISLTLVLILSVFQGCSARDDGKQGIVTNKIPYKILVPDAQSPDLLFAIDKLKSDRGYSIIGEKDGEYIIFVGSGEKNTGGYAIEVKSVEDIEGKTKIVISETSPKKDDMVTQALTYPYVVISINKDMFINVEIVNEKDKSFKKLDDIMFGIVGNITNITKYEDGITILVEGPKTIITEQYKASIRIDEKTMIIEYGQQITMDQIEKDMTVAVIFEGPVAESYPVQGYAKEVIIN